MGRQLECPACGTVLDVPAESAGEVKCPTCRAKVKFKAKPGLATGAPPPIDPEKMGNRPTDAAEAIASPAPRRRKKRKGKGRTAEQPNYKLWIIGGVAAGSVGLLAMIFVIVGMFWFGGARRPADAGGANSTNAGNSALAGTLLDAQPYDPIPWTLTPDGATQHFATDKIVLAASDPASAARFRSGFSGLSLLPDGHGEYLAVTGDPQKRDKLQIVHGQFDPKTGARKSEHPLEGLVPIRSGRLNVFSAPPPAAIAPDGTLAVWKSDSTGTIGDWNSGEIQFWNRGETKPREKAGPKCTGTTWFDWAANGKLLFLRGGKLVSWDVASGKSVFEIGKNLQRPVLLAPSRKWVIARVGSKDPKAPGWLEAYDTATGEIRGRFGAGHMTSLALSPDGTKLAGLQPTHPFDPRNDGLEIHHWDLKTGERQGVIRSNASPSGTLRFWDSDHVLLVYSRVILHHRLFNLRINSDEAIVTFAARDPSVIAYEWPADGRPWWNYKNLLFTVPVPPAQDRDAVFKPGMAVALEIECGDSATNERVSTVMTEILKREGFQVGQSGWKLRISGTKQNSGREMTFSFSKISVPVIKGSVELIAPDGAVVRKSDVNGGFSRGKYFVRHGGSGVQWYDEYDFQGKDPAQAMIEQAWDSFVKGLPYLNWPRTVWKRGNKYEILPTLTIPMPPFAK